MIEPFVLTVIGTRPEAIKMLPVVRALRDVGVAQRLVAAGQHRALIEQVFAAFGERPDRDLGLMTENQTPSDMAARVIRL